MGVYGLWVYMYMCMGYACCGMWVCVICGVYVGMYVCMCMCIPVYVCGYVVSDQDQREGRRPPGKAQLHSPVAPIFPAA